MSEIMEEIPEERLKVLEDRLKMSEKFLVPPKGYKNIDMAKLQFSKLEKSARNCDKDTPALTYSSTRWLENAIYSREIIEEEYNRRMEQVKEQTRIFENKCSCFIK